MVTPVLSIPWPLAFLAMIFYFGIMGVLLAYRLIVVALVLLGLGAKWVWAWIKKRTA